MPGLSAKHLQHTKNHTKKIKKKYINKVITPEKHAFMQKQSTDLDSATQHYV